LVLVPPGSERTVVGRDRDLAALDAALESVRSGAGAAVAIVGEAGIGKSTLLHALAQRAAAAGMLVLEGRAAEHEADVPYGPVVDALDAEAERLGVSRLASLGADREAQLAAVLPGIARGRGPVGAAAAEPAVAAAGAATRFHRHRALAALLALLAGPRPVVLVLDDLHWADDATLELVMHLLRRPPRALLVALGLRPVAAMTSILDAVRAAPDAVECRLGPIEHAAALALLEDVPDAAVRERLAALAGGNPLFLDALARAAAAGASPDSVPATLVAAFQRETARLPPACRALLDGAAVAGDPFDPELAAAAAGIEPGDAPALLDALVSAGLIEPGEGGRRFAFRHPLVRRAAFDAAPPAWRLGAHERVAATLARRGAAVTARAFHVAQCAQPGDRDAVALLTAAGDAARAPAPLAAAHWYEAAARLVPAADVTTVATLTHQRALALLLSGRVREAARLLSELVAAERWPSGVSRGAAVEQLVGMECTLGHFGSALRRLESELTHPGAIDADDRSRLHAMAAVLALPDAETATTHIRCARTNHGRPGLDGVLCDANAAIVELYRGRPVAAEELDSLLDRLAASSDQAIVRYHVALHMSAMALIHGEHLADAARLLERGRRLAEQSGQAHVLTIESDHAATVAFQLGRLGEARTLAVLAEELSRLGGQALYLTSALALQAHCLALEDRVVEAQSLAEDALAAVAGMDPHITIRAGRALAALVVLHADPDRGRALLVGAAGERHELLGAAAALWMLRPRIAAEVALGSLDAARSLVDELSQRANAAGLPLAKARALIADGELTLAEGDASAAVERLLHGIALAHAFGARLDVVGARLTLGRALAATGSAAEATGILRTVTGDADVLGAPALRAAAARELRRLGHRVPGATRPAAGTGLAALTPREHEIVALVAAGRSNKEVGAALHLSAKTIENSLSQIYGKLGVRSRVELAALVAGTPR
jgi:DNA-binding CsgD family transcriptional regulator